ncbi:MAG: hypothetical protein B7X35_02470 [Halothiobacillus sp. 14-56-357]|nr:MAG: hypothetical protein B7X35_02470 [Halothiobacillus sp. 14-56-357]OZB79595.1 MAG: hypothetical protein B7X29_00040 [Halothiobacillus sp. 13-55-115]
MVVEVNKYPHSRFKSPNPKRLILRDLFGFVRKATIARMFVNNATDQRRLVSQYDVVCFDEVSCVSFSILKTRVSLYLVVFTVEPQMHCGKFYYRVPLFLGGGYPFENSLA